MGRKREIHVVFPGMDDGRLTHRVGNFAEDLERESFRSGWGRVEVHGTLPGTGILVVILVDHPRWHGTATLALHRALRDHFLDGECRIGKR